ncbi:MAG: 1-acyl-sn-glycerol-3-phosphate acyltransferase [Chloroflexi bacterium]|nr:1-acyl-sn-glycerol-3-phosphate acyltransferase [Chloroflexota bacterium]
MSSLRDKLHTIWYWINVKTWVQVITFFSINQRISGMENVPRRGPFILVSNHLNNADPPIITAYMPRRIIWMAKQELFDTPVIGIFYHLYGLIPVRRSEADLRAVRRSQEILNRGHVLGMFPEGTRSKDQKLQDAEPGTALLALRAKVPLLPIGIWGTETIRVPRDIIGRSRVSMKIGKLFRLPETKRATRAAIASGSKEIMRHIAELLPPSYRGAYAKDVEEPEDAVTERA